jgi:sensor histidine kinase YesM
MFKETSRSLRLYFGLLAALWLFSSTMMAFKASLAFTFLLTWVSQAIFGLLFAYITFRFEVLLLKSPKFIINVLTGRLVLSFVGFGLSILHGFHLNSIIPLIIALLVYFYLITNLRRLALDKASHEA